MCDNVLNYQMYRYYTVWIWTLRTSCTKLPYKCKPVCTKIFSKTTKCPDITQCKSEQLEPKYVGVRQDLENCSNDCMTVCSKLKKIQTSKYPEITQFEPTVALTKLSR